MGLVGGFYAVSSVVGPLVGGALTGEQVPSSPAKKL